jgi:hypothetical protein
MGGVDATTASGATSPSFAVVSSGWRDALMSLLEFFHFALAPNLLSEPKSLGLSVMAPCFSLFQKVNKIYIYM